MDFRLNNPKSKIQNFKSEIREVIFLPVYCAIFNNSGVVTNR
ncbi:hypothetical protein COO91_04686 [Nostoc flagelliforme CCNUN1]|uniref:Uncharacterized protein n=1 Tax=Nostoc flagelliforme CCNUN1 TaxID=2038116 RepID=A0A2K8STE7_9NOSO|nr:hypothetical protein COO91_04686 [Nostoc flagelliforme CCNUN1]